MYDRLSHSDAPYREQSFAALLDDDRRHHLETALSRSGRPIATTAEHARAEASTENAVESAVVGITSIADLSDEGVPVELDDVTGLSNMEAFRAAMARYLAEGSAPASLLIVSVDNMRRINANYGRSGGDHALHTVAYLLNNYRLAHRGYRRAEIYKYAGPQIAYLLPSATLEEGRDVAEDLRQEIVQSTLFLETLTVSIGVVSTSEVSAGDTATRVNAIERSVAWRVRVAQQSGSNTVCSVDPAGGGIEHVGASILVADPDAGDMESLARRLRDEGYSLISAADGREALEVVHQIRPDAIVCEVFLPKLNAFALREQLRHNAELSRIPFIAISHRRDDTLIRKALGIGINHYLKKPFSLVELSGLLQNLTAQDVP
jgi:diguanylate cyclase (GGDEF)-like protein